MLPTRGGTVRKHLLTTAALAVLAGPAAPADPQYPVDGAPRVPAARSWTGCFVGGHGGGLWGSSEKWIVRTPGGAHSGESLGQHDVDGWIGGVQAGCDYQFDRPIVVGVQGDYAWTDAGGSHASAQEFGVFYHSEVRSIASLTARVGYVRERFLGYVRGGVAWERDHYSASTIEIGTAYGSTVTRSGWTVGAGAEYAITKFLSGVFEYDYYDFGTTEVRFSPQIAGLRPAFVDIEESASVLRAGLNYRFGR
jgi:outer membrane immunogenic protein